MGRRTRLGGGTKREIIEQTTVVAHNDHILCGCLPQKVPLCALGSMARPVLHNLQNGGNFARALTVILLFYGPDDIAKQELL